MKAQVRAERANNVNSAHVTILKGLVISFIVLMVVLSLTL